MRELIIASKKVKPVPMSVDEFVEYARLCEELRNSLDMQAALPDFLVEQKRITLQILQRSDKTLRGDELGMLTLEQLGAVVHEILAVTVGTDFGASPKVNWVCNRS